MSKNETIETFNKNLIGQKIQPINTNVEKGLVQLTISHSLFNNSGITILGKDGFVLHKHNCRFIYDEYLSSERENFLYSNISEYISRPGEKNYHVTLKIDEPYVVINNGKVSTVIVKTNKSGVASITEKNISLISSTKEVNREELNNLLSPTENQEKVIILNEDGKVFDYSVKVPTDEEIIANEKARLQKEYEEDLVPHLTTSNYGFNSSIKKYVEKLLKDLSLENIPENISVMPKNMIIVRYNGSSLSVVRTNVEFLKPGVFLIKEDALPIKEHDLKEVKGRILREQDEKIPLVLNPHLKDVLKIWSDYLKSYKAYLESQESQKTIDAMDILRNGNEAPLVTVDEIGEIKEAEDHNWNFSK